METPRQTVQEIDWQFRGYLAKYFGYLLIITSILTGLYRYFILNSHIMELVGIIIIGLFLGGFSLLISWFLIPSKKINQTQKS